MKMWIEPFLLLLCRWFGFCVSDTTEISQSYESVKEQLNNYREAYVDTKYQHYLRDLLYVRIKTNRSFINKECLKEEGLSYFKWAHQTISKYHLNDTQFVRDVQNRKEWLEQRLESMVAVKDVDILGNLLSSISKKWEVRDKLVDAEMQYLEEIRNIREPNPKLEKKLYGTSLVLRNMLRNVKNSYTELVENTLSSVFSYPPRQEKMGILIKEWELQRLRIMKEQDSTNWIPGLLEDLFDEIEC